MADSDPSLRKKSFRKTKKKRAQSDKIPGNSSPFKQPVQLRPKKNLGKRISTRKKSNSFLELTDLDGIVRPLSSPRTSIDRSGRRKSSIDITGDYSDQIAVPRTRSATVQIEPKAKKTKTTIHRFVELPCEYKSLRSLLSHNNSEYATKQLPLPPRSKNTSITYIRRKRGKSDPETRLLSPKYRIPGFVNEKYAGAEDLETLCSNTFQQFSELLLNGETTEEEKIKKLEDTAKDLQTAHQSSLMRIEKLKVLLEKFKVELKTTSQALQFSQNQLNKERIRCKELTTQIEDLKGET